MEKICLYKKNQTKEPFVIRLDEFSHESRQIYTFRQMANTEFYVIVLVFWIFMFLTSVYQVFQNSSCPHGG